jgi:N-acetylglutamate synthase-like GNAT family acetyltransferase
MDCALLSKTGKDIKKVGVYGIYVLTSSEDQYFSLWPFCDKNG